MLQTRAGRRGAIAYAVLLAVSLLLLAFSGTSIVRELRRGVGFALSPIQEGLASGTRTVTSVFAAFGQVEELRRDNQRLEERIQDLEVENRRLEQTGIENRQLTAILQLRSSLAYETTAAAVIARGAAASERVITLDQGSDRKIAVDDVVLAGGGALVGVVVDVGRNFSHVRLITDTRSVVIGLIETSRATGDVQGQLSGTLTMSRIPVTDEVSVDETVVTAGIDLGNDIRSPYPKGLLIGTVVDVRRDPNAVVQMAFVQPAAQLDRLEFVLVITNADSIVAPDPNPSGSPGPSASGPVRSRRPGASVAPSSETGLTPLPSAP